MEQTERDKTERRNYQKPFCIQIKLADTENWRDTMTPKYTMRYASEAKMKKLQARWPTHSFRIV